jgi:hypothetical protein
MALAVGMMSFSLRFWISASALLALPSLALAQEVDYSAGKSAPRLFASDCSACHRSPQGLANGRSAHALAVFLREHYTTKGESAGLLGAYLAGIGGRPQPAARAPAAAAPGQAEPVATTQAPRPPGNVGGDRAKAGETRRAKLTPAEPERENPKATEALLVKLRGYASTGEEAKARPPVRQETPLAISAPPTAAESPGTPSTAAQVPKPEASQLPGAAPPAPAEPAASAPAAPVGEKPPATPPG